MEIREIVRYIYRHALSMIEPWGEDVLEALAVPELTEDGFRIMTPAYPQYSVGLREFMGTIFVRVCDPMSNYSSSAYDQKKARAIYEQMVNGLLAA